MKHEVVPIRAYYVISPRCAVTLVTVDVAFFNVGMMNLPIALAVAHDEGDAGDPVLYARTLRARRW